LYQIWHKWIPSSETQNFLKFAGFKRTLRGGALRVFSLNTILYHVRNKAFAKVDDPCGQLAWLAAELHAARAASARVILAGHVPPVAIATSPSQAGYYWWPDHQDKFLALMHEFSDVITTSLWGHAHHDLVSIAFPLCIVHISKSPPIIRVVLDRYCRQFDNIRIDGAVNHSVATFSLCNSKLTTKKKIIRSHICSMFSIELEQ
jgi:hypothetical protein